MMLFKYRPGGLRCRADAESPAALIKPSYHAVIHDMLESNGGSGGGARGRTTKVEQIAERVVEPELSQ